MNEKLVKYIENMVKYLKNTKDHYNSLSSFMKEQKKEQYANEHSGKVKFINLLLFKIKMGDFENE